MYFIENADGRRLASKRSMIECYWLTRKGVGKAYSKPSYVSDMLARIAHGGSVPRTTKRAIESMTVVFIDGKGIIRTNAKVFMKNYLESLAAEI